MLRLGSRGLGSRVLGFMEKKPTVEKRERERERESERERFQAFLASCIVHGLSEAGCRRHVEKVAAAGLLVLLLIATTSLNPQATFPRKLRGECLASLRCCRLRLIPKAPIFDKPIVA